MPRKPRDESEAQESTAVRDDFGRADERRLAPDKFNVTIAAGFIA